MWFDIETHARQLLAFERSPQGPKMAEPGVNCTPDANSYQTQTIAGLGFFVPWHQGTRGPRPHKLLNLITQQFPPPTTTSPPPKKKHLIGATHLSLKLQS